MDKLGVFMQTKHLCVLIHIWAKGEVGVMKPPVNYFYRPFLGGTSFVNHCCYLCLLFAFPSVHCCLVVT